MAAVAVLVYDGDCGFCARSARWLERRAARLDVIPWQQADLTALGLTEAECASAVQCVRDGRRVSGGAAAAAALRECRQPYRILGSVLGARPLRLLVDHAYAWVSAHRHRLPGGTPACASDGDEGRRARVRREGAGEAVTPAHR